MHENQNKNNQKEMEQNKNGENSEKYTEFLDPDVGQRKNNKQLLWKKN